MTADLTRFKFGFAKVLSVKREWDETAFRAALSAVSIALAPVIGFGGISWKAPGKRVSYSVLRAELVLCRNCSSQAGNFSGGALLKDTYCRYHPWADKAQRIGYETCLSTDDLANLTPS